MTKKRSVCRVVENFWYYHKLGFCLSLAGILLAGWFAKDVLLRPKPDLIFSVATAHSLLSYNPGFEEDAARYAEDYNGDGQLIVTVDEMSTNRSISADLQKFIGIVSSGDELLFLLDGSTYRRLYTDAGEDPYIFLNWEELYPGLEIARGDRLYINETPLGKKWRLSYLLDQYYLCVRRLGDDVTASDDEKHREVQRRCLDFVHEIIVEAYPEWADKKPDIP